MLQHSLYQSGLLGGQPPETLTGFIPNWLELGETGVVAFFLVSGFVIPLSLEKTAQQNGLQVITTGLFAKSDSLPGLGSSPEFMNAIFTANQNARAEMVQTQQGYVIYNVLEVQPPSTPSFEQIKEKVESDYTGSRAQQLLAQKTKELSDRAHADHDLKKAAQALGAQYKTSDLVGPTSQAPDLGSMEGSTASIFDLKTGEISNPINAGNNGAVVALTERQEPPAEQMFASRDRIQDELLQQKRAEFMQIYIANLRDTLQKEGKIRINQQVYKQIANPAGQKG